MHLGQRVGQSEVESCQVLIFDFDGTITNLDTGELVLTRLSDGDWRYHHEQYLRGEFSFEECLRRQYSHLKFATKASILSLVDEEVRVRAYFAELVDAAQLAEVPVVVASYGLDFCIEHVLDGVRNGSDIRIYSPRTTLGSGGTRLGFPRRRVKGSINLKDDVVAWYKQKGFKVIFAGDGASDFPAASLADRSFAIEGSELAKMCEIKGVKCTSITDFRPVANTLFG